MNPREKFGEEFVFEHLSIPSAGGERLSCHQACVCITPKKNQEDTLAFAWDVLREVAAWLAGTLEQYSEEERFQLIVAWSKSVRPHQGHIFKVWGFKERIRMIAGCVSYQDYVRAAGDNWAPMPRWEKDVFEQKTA